MIIATLASRVLGQLRETAIAAWFGQTGLTDVYRQSFRLPDMLFLMIAGGALSSSFVPVFTDYYKNGKEDEAWKFFSIVTTFMALVLLVLILFGEIFARQLVPLLAPGFSSAKLDATTHLTRIVLPAQFCFFIGGLMMATFNVRGRFLVPALGPIIYNLAIIIGGWLGHKTGIAGLSWGALIGAVLGIFLLQFFYLRRLGLRFRPSLELRHPGVVKAGKLVLPVLIGLSLPQFFSAINGFFASWLADGTISILDNANKLMQAPLGIFAQAIGIAIFPTMAAMASRGEMQDYRATFLKGLRVMWFITLPLSLLMMVLAPEIISVLLQYKKFTAADTRLTATALVCYCTGLFAFSSQALLNRAFYAVQNTITPLVIGTLSTVVFIILNLLLIGPLGFKGLALAGSLAAILHVLWMTWTLRAKVGMPLRGLTGSFLKFLLAGLLSAGVGWLVRGWLLAACARADVPGKATALLTIGVVSAVSGCLYLALMHFIGSEEMQYAKNVLLRRRKV